MSDRIKKIAIIFIVFIICMGALFIYEVKREHHYTPQTAEILIDDWDALKSAFVLKDGYSTEFNLAEHITFVSDVENGTANLETKKKVFGFYECDINRVYDDYRPQVTYRVSDESIAVIDDKGVITALAKGKTTVIVSADEISIEVPITVYKGVVITELEQDITILKGDSIDLLKLEEYDVCLSELYSSDEKVVIINQDGVATAIDKGKAEIFAYKDNSDTEKISAYITVKQPVESVSIKNLTLYVGESAVIQPSYMPRNADYGTSFKYKTADSTIAAINGNVVSAVKAGETVITVTSGNGKTAQAKIVVLNYPKATPSVVTISKAEYDAYNGEKFSDGSPYVSYFKISFDHPVIGFQINYVHDDFTKITTGDAIYKNASVGANSPLYFAVCINTSDVVSTRGFSYVNKDGSRKFYWLHFSGKDGSVLFKEY